MISLDYLGPKVRGMYLGLSDRKLAESLLLNQIRNCGALLYEKQKAIPQALEIWEKLKYIRGVYCHHLERCVTTGTITRTELDFVKKLAQQESECLMKSLSVPRLEPSECARNEIASRIRELERFQKLEYTEV